MLEALKDVKKLGGFDVSHIYGTAIATDFINHVHINQYSNAIGFRIADDASGRSGCYPPSLIDAASHMLSNQVKHSEATLKAIGHLEKALQYLRSNT